MLISLRIQQSQTVCCPYTWEECPELLPGFGKQSLPRLGARRSSILHLPGWPRAVKRRRHPHCQPLKRGFQPCLLSIRLFFGILVKLQLLQIVVMYHPESAL